MEKYLPLIFAFRNQYKLRSSSNLQSISEAHSEPCQTLKMERFAKVVSQ